MHTRLALLVAVAVLLLPYSHSLSLDRLLGGLFAGVKAISSTPTGSAARPSSTALVPQPLIESRPADVSRCIEYSIAELPKVGYDSSLEEGHVRDEQLRRVGSFLVNIFFNDGDAKEPQQTTKALLIKQILTTLLRELRTRAGSAENKMLIAREKTAPGSPDTASILGCVEMYLVNQKPKIANLAVDPSARRSGIASELVDRCLLHAKAMGHSEVCLNVEKDNHQAILFYEKKGFSVASEKMDQRYNVNGFYLRSEKVVKVHFVKMLNDTNVSCQSTAAIAALTSI